MIIGIVGAEATKFTPKGELAAKDWIRRILSEPNCSGVSSGHCHLGGIDIWTEEIADELGVEKFIFPPRNREWETGYRPRNIQIAMKSDKVYCIAVNVLPADFKGMRFKQCYHCKNNYNRPDNHVKGGGCWTMYYAMKHGKDGQLIVVEN